MAKARLHYSRYTIQDQRPSEMVGWPRKETPVRCLIKCICCWPSGGIPNPVSTLPTRSAFGGWQRNQITLQLHAAPATGHSSPATRRPFLRPSCH